MRTLFAVLALVASYSVATARSLDSPLPPNAKILRTETMTVGPNGISADLFVPGKGVFTIDYLVEQGKSLRLGVLTGAQMQEATTGHKVSGPPLISTVINGAGSQSLRLERGNYAVVFIQNGSRTANLSYRASYEPGD